ncbi:MAG: AMP-binding protein, partial [Cytophagales bacterium]|nr:AMP-binding protein [Cytophagales bacterium]
MNNLKARYISREYKPYLAFWESKLSDNPEPFRFGNTLTGVDQPTPQQEQCVINPGPAAGEVIGKITGGQALGVMVVLTAALKILMCRLENHGTVVIDTPLLREAGRPHGLAEKVSLIDRIRPQATLKALLEQTKATLLNSYSFQDYPLATVFEDQARFITGASNVCLYCPALHDEPVHPDRYDLLCRVDPADGGCTLTLTYNVDLYGAHLIPYVQDYLTQIILAFADPDAGVDTVDLLSDALREKITHHFNRTDAQYPADQTLHGQFERQVEQTPESVAILSADVTLTYRELNEAANRLARHLRTSFGVLPGQVVGIMAERSERMMIAVLGVLKAGGAYLPIDPAYPRERKQYLLSDAGVGLLLTDSECLYELAGYAGDLFALDLQLPCLDESPENPDNCNVPADLAYVIYTSGSTGQPKGVMIEHRNCLNMSLDQVRQFGVKATDKVLQFASFSFDASVS